MYMIYYFIDIFEIFLQNQSIVAPTFWCPNLKVVVTSFKDISELIDEGYKARISVMRVGSDTFGDPIFQKGLQN